MSNNAERYFGNRPRRIQRETDLGKELDGQAREHKNHRRGVVVKEKERFTFSDLYSRPERPDTVYLDEEVIPRNRESMFTFLRLRYKLSRSSEGLPPIWREFENTHRREIERFALGYLRKIHKGSGQQESQKKGKKKRR